MKLNQQPTQYQPITFTLETAEEASAFQAMVDEAQPTTEPARRIANHLSNAFTLGELEIPATQATRLRTAPHCDALKPLNWPDLKAAKFEAERKISGALLEMLKAKETGFQHISITPIKGKEINDVQERVIAYSVEIDI